MAPPREARMEMIYEHAFGTHEKCVPLILRIMFGKSLDILKYGMAAQIKRVEMDVMELEGDSAVPRIGFPPNTQNLPRAPQHVAAAGTSQPALLILPFSSRGRDHPSRPPPGAALRIWADL